MAFKDPTGVPYWNFTTGNSTVGNGAANGPVVSPDGNTVYVGALDGHLYAVATADGTQRWKFATNDGFVNIHATPTVSADSSTVYVSRNDVGLVAINAADGKPRWELPLSINLAQVPAGRPVLSPDGGTLYMAVADKNSGTFYAINTVNGKRRWSTFDPSALSYNLPTVSPDGNTVYVGSASGATSAGFYAINATDGTRRWTYTAVGYSWSIPVVSPNGDTVYVGHDHNSFHAINAADGTPRWEVPLDLLTRFSSPIVSHDGSTVYTTECGVERLCALDTTYGTLQWEFLGEGVTSNVVLSPDGRTVYAGVNGFDSGDGNSVVYAVLTAPPPPPPPTPAKIEW